MNTKFSYRALAMFMAFLMFSSSIGFSMDIHYCGEELKSFSFFWRCRSLQDDAAKTRKEI